MAPQVGDIVAGYRLEELLGVGGSDCPVFRATHLRLRREVALKLLPRERASDDFVRRFEREAQLAATLHHSNVVDVYDFGDTDEVLYLAMRLVRGPDLQQLIDSGPLSLTRTCEVLGQVADALDAAHAAKLVHRDVKPSNIFLDPEDAQGGNRRAYIGDFGLTLRRDVSSVTRALWYGSPRYLAPERWTGSQPEPSMDVYALGCVAYACLTGQPPFTGDSEERLRFEHAQAPPPLLSAGLADVPPAVDEVLSKAIAKQPADRYGGCGEFVDALRAAGVTPGGQTLSGPLVAYRPPGKRPVEAAHRTSSPGQERQPGDEPGATPAPAGARRRRLPLAVAAGALIVVLVTALVSALTDADVVVGAATPLPGLSPGISTAPLSGDLNALVTDARGNLYFVLRDTHTVRRLTSEGELTTVAGGNGPGFSGDGGPATRAGLNHPHGLAIDADGNLVIADTGSRRVRRVNARTGEITTIAGTGEAGTDGDGGPATEAELDGPTGVAVGGHGEIYVVESNGNRIREIDHGRITTVAGTGTAAFSGDGGPAVRAELDQPLSVAVHGEDVYVTDAGNDRVRRIDSHGIITTVAGIGQKEGGKDGDPATTVELEGADNLAVGPDGQLYVAERFAHRVRKVDLNGRITTVAGTGVPGFSGDGGAGVKARVAGPNAVAVAPDGVIYVGDTLNRRIRRIDTTGAISTVAGHGPVYPGDGLRAIEASLRDPRMATVGPLGEVYIADAGNNRIRRRNRDGSMSTVVGTGAGSYGGDGGPATEAELDYPSGIAFGADGTMYIADAGNNRIRAVDTHGVITTVAGLGRSGSSGDGGAAKDAELTDPQSVEVAADGSLYIAERAGNRIRRVDKNGIITTVAGTGAPGFSGDGGPATSASLDDPTGVHVAADGSVYICDHGNFRVREVDSSGVITTVAGNGTQGYAGDGGPAVEAQLGGPFTVVTVDGNVYIADDNAHRIRRLDSSGVITTVVGSGEDGEPSDGDAASTALLALPAGIGVTPDGTLLITDVGNHQVYSVGEDRILRIVAGVG